MKTVIFDIDGLLVDTERLFLIAGETVFPEMGYPYDVELFKRCIGKNRTGTKYEIFATFGEDFPFDEYIVKIYDEIFGLMDDGKLDIKPYVIEALDYFKENGYKMAIGTSSYYEKATKVLKNKNILHYFDEIVTGDMVEHGKPSPEIFLKAAERLGEKPEDIIVFEDSFNGVIAGYDGGFKVVMIPDILQPSDEILAKTTEVHKNFKEFLENTALLK